MIKQGDHWYSVCSDLTEITHRRESRIQECESRLNILIKKVFKNRDFFIKTVIICHWFIFEILNLLLISNSSLLT